MSTSQVGPTVDLPQAADIMKIHPKSVQDLIYSGALPAAKLGRGWVMMTKDVIAHVEAEVMKQTAARMRMPLKSPKPGRKVATA